MMLSFESSFADLAHKLMQVQRERHALWSCRRRNQLTGVSCQAQTVLILNLLACSYQSKECLTPGSRRGLQQLLAIIRDLLDPESRAKGAPLASIHLALPL